MKYAESLNFDLDDQSVISISKAILKKILKFKQHGAALKFLIEQKNRLKAKGDLLMYKQLKLAHYLSPQNPNPNINDKLYKYLLNNLHYLNHGISMV